MKLSKIVKIFLPVALGGLLFSCSDLSSDQAEMAVPQGEDKKELPEQESWGTIINISKEGRKVAEIWAGYVANYNRRNETVLKDSVHADFFDKDGNHSSVLTANEGTVENQSRNLVARGNVIVVSDSGVVLKTEILNWDHARQKITSEVPVVFTSEDDTLYGDSFISNPDLTDYEITNARGSSKRLVPIKQR